jgi:hypothetical protein
MHMCKQVRAVRLRRDRIVVALEHKVLTYNFSDLKLLHQIETLGNSRGLLALSSTADTTVLACPGLHTGQVRRAAAQHSTAPHGGPTAAAAAHLCSTAAWQRTASCNSSSSSGTATQHTCSKHQQ